MNKSMNDVVIHNISEISAIIMIIMIIMMIMMIIMMIMIIMIILQNVHGVVCEGHNVEQTCKITFIKSRTF